jgi:methyl-accepting chemotaxis protein
MDEVTQQNAALVEEAAAAAESLEEQAHNLSSAVSIFKLDDTAAAPRLSAPALASARRRRLRHVVSAWGQKAASLTNQS